MQPALLNYKTRGFNTLQEDIHQKETTHQAIFVIHGLFGTLDNLNGIARALEEEHYVISVDVRNHGKSFQTQSMSYAEMASDIIVLADHLGLSTFAVVGHSMGGKIAMQLALDHPNRVTKLAIADMAPVGYHSRHDAIIQGLEAIQIQPPSSRKKADDILSTYIDEPGVRQFLLKSLEKSGDVFGWQFHLSAIKENYPLIIGPLEEGKSFHGEVLFIKGADSDYILPQHREETIKRFPNSQAKIISGAGHWLHAEKPTIFNRIVCNFIASK